MYDLGVKGQHDFYKTQIDNPYSTRMHMINQEKVITILSKNRKLLDSYGVREIRLFGSVSRGQAKAGSDVDLLVEFEPSAHIGLFEFSRLRNELSRLLGCTVDLATPDAIHKSIKENVLREAIRAA